MRPFKLNSNKAVAHMYIYIYVKVNIFTSVFIQSVFHLHDQETNPDSSSVGHFSPSQQADWPTLLTQCFLMQAWIPQLTEKAMQMHCFLAQQEKGVFFWENDVRNFMPAKLA